MGELEQGQHELAGSAGPPQRDPTGVPQLDEVLGGGIPRGTLVLVVGPPGSGKTTLATQLAFAAGQTGRQVLIVTALSEPTDKLIAHLRTYRFFDEELIGGTIQVVSLRQYLPQGLAAAAEMITADARRQHVSLALLDGFSGVRDAAESVQGARAFLYDLGTSLGVLGATVVVTSEGMQRDTAHFLEMTTADTIIGLHFALRGVQQRRAIEAIKARATAPLPGLHGLEIGAAGIRVYPRLEARVTRAAKVARDQQAQRAAATQAPTVRAAFDLPALDTLLEDGLTARTSTLLLGSPGVGKTLLGLHFALAGVREGQPVVFVSFHETEEELHQKAEAFALAPELHHALAPDGGMTLLRQPSVECDADMLAEELLAAVDRTVARRVIIDSLAELDRAVTETSGSERIPGFYAALREALYLRGVTTLLIRETGVVAGSLMHRGEMVSLLAANVLWLQQVIYRGRLHRVLSVPKMRYSAHDTMLREYTIAAPVGLAVLAPEESAPGVLVGIARQEGYGEQTGAEGTAPP